MSLDKYLWIFLFKIKAEVYILYNFPVCPVSLPSQIPFFSQFLLPFFLGVHPSASQLGITPLFLFIYLFICSFFAKEWFEALNRTLLPFVISYISDGDCEIQLTCKCTSQVHAWNFLFIHI